MEDEHQQQTEVPAVGDVNNGDLLYGDLLGEEFTSGGAVHDINCLPDTLIVFDDEFSDPNHAPQTDGVTTQYVLLDLGDGGGGGAFERHSHAEQQNSGSVDLLGSSDGPFAESFVNIPPPMEFSDPFRRPSSESPSQADRYSTPVTNIDDLLGLDFLTSLDPATEGGADSEPLEGCAGTQDGSSGDAFVLLPDLQGPPEQLSSEMSKDGDSRCPQLPSETLCELSSIPPPIPFDPPPDPSDDPLFVTSVHALSASSDSVTECSSSPGSEDLEVEVPSPSEAQTHSLSSVSTDSPTVGELEHPPVPSPDALPVLSEESPLLPVSDPSSTISEDDPPALPVDQPPLIPTDQIASTAINDSAVVETADINYRSSQGESTLNSSNTTTLFLPSPNPADNVTQISVTHVDSDQNSHSSNNNTIHITDITVTSPSTNTSSVTVTKPKPNHQGTESHKDGAVSGAAMVLVDNSSLPSATHIQFDNSTRETVMKSTLPPDAFMPTSVGVTRTIRPSTVRSEEEDEEEITPMMVHRDHKGNTMAAPSPPETLGRQSTGPRKLDQDAKRDLQVVLSRMTEISRTAKKESTEAKPAVDEEDIVPVKLTWQEAEMAQDVLSTWMDKESESPLPTPPAPKSGFQTAVGTVINIQSGKEPLPDSCVFLTTMGVTKTAPAGEKDGEGEGGEEQIIPMSLHKDHLGNKHYAPSPPESLGKHSGRRQLDSAAKQDIADLLSGMAHRSKTTTTEQKLMENDVTEEPVVATVLSREESRLAKEAISRWLEAEKQGPQPTSSPFHRLVENVMHTADETDHKETVCSTDQTDHPDTQTDPLQDPSLNSDRTCSAEPLEASVPQPVLLPSAASPPDSTPPEPPRQDSSQASLSHTHAKPLSTQNTPQPATEAERSIASESNHRSDAENKKPAPLATRIVIENRSARTIQSAETKAKSSQRAAVDTATTSPVEIKPQSSQRSVRAPAKIASLSQTSSALSSSKPKSRLGGLSVTTRAPVLPLSSSRLSSRTDYAKTRNDESPFLVEVLKGIVGLGIKVKVNGEGHVEVTEVQRNSPMDKNGNVRKGDYVLSINTTELRGLADGRVQQVLRLLPRGLVKLVVTTRPPPPLVVQGNDVSEQASPKPGGAYSQFGVRLSPRPFSPSTDRPSPSLTSPPVIQDKVPCLAQSLSTSTAASDQLSPAAVVQNGSPTSPVCPDSRQSDSSASSVGSSTFKGSPALRSLPGSSEREAASSASASLEERKVTSRVVPAEKDLSSSAQHTLISPSSEPPAGPCTTRPDREEEAVAFPQQPSSSPSPDKDPGFSPPSECPTDTGPGGQTVPSTAQVPEEPTSVSVRKSYIITEVDDMETHKLSTALSPRFRSAQNHHQEQVSQPKPTPRQRASVPPASLSVGRKGPGEDRAGDQGPRSSEKDERHLSPSEIVAAASKRPSGRDDDLPSPPSPPRDEVAKKERTKFPPRNSRDVSPPVGPSKTVRTTARVDSRKEHIVTVDSASLSKSSPVPTPRHRSRLSEEIQHNRSGGGHSGKSERRTVAEAEPQNKARAENNGVVHAHRVTILPESADPRPDVPQSTASPPVARRTRQRVLSDASKEMPCPTLVSARLRAFADPNVPTLEDQAPNRRFVSSAARMFEQKASESGSSSLFNKPTKSSLSVSSVVKSLNSQDTDPFNRSGVTMRKKSVARESSDLGVKERRKSMPISFAGSSLSLSGNLSHVKNLSASTVSLSSHDLERDEHHRLNSALSPRHGNSNTTSLKSVIGSRDYGEGRRSHSPPSVGKKSTDSKRTSMSDVTFRSRSSMHDHNVTSQSNRKSWSPHTTDSVSPKSSISAARRRAERLGASLSYSMSSLASIHRGGGEQSGKVDSTVRKFDDLLSYRHAVDSDEELPKVSNSLSLEFPSRNTNRDVKDTARRSARATGSDKKTEDRSAGETETKRRTAEQSSARSSGGRTQMNKKPPDLPASVSQPLSPSSVLPSCLKTPDDVIVEERKTFTFSEKDLRAKDKNVELGKGTAPSADVEQKAEKPQLAQTNDKVQEAAVGYIVAQGLPGQTQHVKDRGQVGINKEATHDRRTEDTASTTQPQHSDRQDPLVTLGVTPKKERDQSTKGEVHETDDIRSVIPKQDRSASKRETTEPEDIYPEQDAPIDSETLEDLNRPETVKSHAEQVTSATFEKGTAPVEHTVSLEVLPRHAQDPDENGQSEEDDDDDSSPPPLPEEGPPPLPGAPPPPLALSGDVDMLVDVEDLEGMLPFQETPSPGQEVGVSETPPKERVSGNVEEDVDTMEPGVSASTFDIPLQQTVTALTSQSNEQKSTPDADLVSFRSSSSSSPPSPQTLPPSTEVDVLVEFAGKEGEEHGHDNPPVSDTLSQDSGVQDEDMSEDGLRFSMDDSPSSTSMFDAAITPDEVPVSVLGESKEGRVTESQDATNEVIEGQGVKCEDTEGQVPENNVTEGQVTENHVTEGQVTENYVTEGQVTEKYVTEGKITENDVTKGRVTENHVSEGQVTGGQMVKNEVSVESRAQIPCHQPVASKRRTVMHAPVSPASLTTSPHAAPESTVAVVSVSQTSTAVPNLNDSAPQGSASLRCSSNQGEEEEQEEIPASPGGVSTTGDAAATAEARPQAAQLSTVDHPLPAKISTESSVSKRDFRDEKNKKTHTVPREKPEKDDEANGAATDNHSQRETTSPPTPSPTEDDQDDHLEEPPDHHESDDASSESAEVSSARKWCILDQSGSLFIQGASNSPVEVPKAMLRQVSSLQPAELAEAVMAGNKDLDGAKLPVTLELRLVSARELGGEAVRVDVAQREDYFVQVTKVHSKGSSLQEADLLLSVDGHSLRHRRPAQVHTQLDNAGPKGVLFAARGLKLPLSVATALAAAATDEGNNSEKKNAPSGSAPSPSSPRTPPTGTPTRAVQVGPGMYEVTLTKGPAGVGFCLEGGLASPRGDMPILIKRIFKGGPAEKGGALKVKDEILSVNGVDFTAMRHYEAWNHLKAVQDGQITLRIRREE